MLNNPELSRRSELVREEQVSESIANKFAPTFYFGIIVQNYFQKNQQMGPPLLSYCMKVHGLMIVRRPR